MQPLSLCALSCGALSCSTLVCSGSACSLNSTALVQPVFGTERTVVQISTSEACSIVAFGSPSYIGVLCVLLDDASLKVRAPTSEQGAPHLSKVPHALCDDPRCHCALVPCLQCGGDNYGGKLGQGSTTAVAVPTTAAAGDAISAISLGTGRTATKVLTLAASPDPCFSALHANSTVR